MLSATGAKPTNPDVGMDGLPHRAVGSNKKYLLNHLSRLKPPNFCISYRNVMG